MDHQPSLSSQVLKDNEIACRISSFLGLTEAIAAQQPSSSLPLAEESGQAGATEAIGEGDGEGTDIAKESTSTSKTDQDGGTSSSTTATTSTPPIPLLLISPPACLLHDVPGHFERPARVASILQALKDIKPGLLPLDAPYAKRETLELYHSKKHVDKVLSLFLQATASNRLFKIDSDTEVMPHTGEAALKAVGAVCMAIDEVMNHRAVTAFLPVRPPGHHAEVERAMGFCFFNNCAIGAQYARKEYGTKRVASIDIDVHHGNGVQDGFQDDHDLFYASTHQGYGHYPGTGEAHERGIAGNIVNVPLPEGAGSIPFRQAYIQDILPKLRAFKPELILINCGFDAHEDDPLGEMELVPEDYHWIAAKLIAVGKECGAPVVSVLEGGYDLNALAESSVAHVQGLLGEDFDLQPLLKEEEAAVGAEGGIAVGGEGEGVVTAASEAVVDIGGAPGPVIDRVPPSFLTALEATAAQIAVVEEMMLSEKLGHVKIGTKEKGSEGEEEGGDSEGEEEKQEAKEK